MIFNIYILVLDMSRGGDQQLKKNKPFFYFKLIGLAWKAKINYKMVKQKQKRRGNASKIRGY